MKTSDESIYALGDAVEIMDFVNKQPTIIVVKNRNIKEHLVHQLQKYLIIQLQQQEITKKH